MQAFAELLAQQALHDSLNENQRNRHHRPFPAGDHGPFRLRRRRR
jgi:hypothetical protein